MQIFKLKNSSFVTRDYIIDNSLFKSFIAKITQRSSDKVSLFIQNVYSIAFSGFMSKIWWARSEVLLFPAKCMSHDVAYDILVFLY